MNGEAVDAWVSGTEMLAGARELQRAVASAGQTIGMVSASHAALMAGEAVLPARSFMDTYGNPYLGDCSCGCLHAKRRPCSLGREILAERHAHDERKALLAVLTDEDLAWLAAHGWRP